jgi:hypothetical protein
MFEFLFGAKRKCVKVRRSKRDKRKKCKAKKCAIRSRRRSDLRKKCRNSKRRVQRRVQQLGGTPVEQAEAAGAIAAQDAEAQGLPPAQIVGAAQEAAAEAGRIAGANPQEMELAVQVAGQNARGAIIDNYPGQNAINNYPGQNAINNYPGQNAINNYPGQNAIDNYPGQNAIDDYSDLNLTGLAFGSKGCSKCGGSRFGSKGCSKCGGSRFGSECSVLPRTAEGCTGYNVNGMFPCYLTASGCRKRIDKLPRHLMYVVRQSSSPAVREVLREEIPAPVVPDEHYDINELDFGRTSGFGRFRTIYWRGVDGKIKTMKKGWNFCKKHRNNPHCNPKYAHRIVSNSKGKSYFKNKVKPKVKKPPHSIRRMCRKLKIKITKKAGKRRVYKSTSVLKKEIAKKMRKMRKMKR